MKKQDWHTKVARVILEKFCRKFVGFCICFEWFIALAAVALTVKAEKAQNRQNMPAAHTVTVWIFIQLYCFFSINCEFMSWLCQYTGRIPA